MPSKLIKLTSSHDPSHVNHSQFRYNMGMHEPEFHEATGILLVGAVIPNKQYNVNSNNNVLRYNLNGAGVASLTVPVGQYTTATLMSYIQSNVANTTITQNATTQKINFACTQTLDLYSEDGDALSTLAPYLGIYTTLNIGAGGNDDAESIPDLNGVDMFLIESTTLAPNNLVSSFPSNATSTKNVIANVPVDVVFGNNQTYEYTGYEDSRIVFSARKNITNIDIKITDQNHNDLDLQSPCTLIFRVFY